jgi:hypothetical protein
VAVAIRVYFVVIGLAMFGMSFALLINFKGLGRHWDDQMHTQTTELIKFARIPWLANPAQGRVARPYVAIFAIALSIVLILIGLFASRQ